MSRHIAEIVKSYAYVTEEGGNAEQDQDWLTADLISLLGAIALVLKERDDEST